MAISSLAQNAPAFLQHLPTLLFLSDVMFYVFGTLFFGSIAVKGFRGYLHPLAHFGLRVLMGIAGMIGGLAFQGWLPFLNTGIYQLFRLDILAGALISSAVFGVGLYLISFRLINIKALKMRIEKMEGRIKKAKSIPEGKRGWKDPLKAVGIVIIIVLAGLSLLSFRGFPRLSENLLSSLGVTEQDVQAISGIQGGQVPEGCVPPLTLLQTAGLQSNTLPVARDPAVQNAIEQHGGSKVVEMRKTAIEGTDYFIAFTENQHLCYSTKTQFCSCIDVSGFLGKQ